MDLMQNLDAIDQGRIDDVVTSSPSVSGTRPAPLVSSSLSTTQRRAWSAIESVWTYLHSRLEAELHRECGMTAFEYELLELLSQEGAPTPMSSVAHRVNSSLSRLSHVVRRLEERGWVRRRTSPEDARVTLVSLTGKGAMRFADSVATYERMVNEYFLQHLNDPELEATTEICVRILRSLHGNHWLVEELEADGITGSPSA
ncbi:MAG: MarR family transcriptional regulator [Micrococcus sp.]|nr:MarR family transcriptional regulator [Micrococcus sp.]